MKRFIGLDGHDTSCTFVVLDPKGQVKRKSVVETNGQALVEFVKTVPGRRYLCVEEGTQSQWFYEILSPHVHDIAIVQGRRKPGPKNDERDALELAHRFRTNDLGPRIYKTPESLTALKDLVRTYEMINTDQARVKNRIKSFYRSRGVPYSKSGCPFCPKDSSKASRCTKPGFHQALAFLNKELRELVPIKAEAQKAMVAEARRHPVMRILKTVPGLGPVRSAELIAIVITPYRFRTSRQFWKYCGLAVVQRSSSDWVKQPNGQWLRAPAIQTRGLNKDFNHMAKAIFKGAAMTVITGKKNNPLRQDYDRLLANGTKPNLARLTIARKIAAMVLSMWKNQEVYNTEKYRLNRQ
jgi:transposase